MKDKTQILIIHGGTTFKSKKNYLGFLKNRKVTIEDRKRWTDEYLTNKLGNDFEIIKPSMPLKENAKYEEWKIHFERFFPQLKNNIILIGGSLGGIFLAKYLSENKFPKKILATYLIAPPFDNTIYGEDLVGGFKLKSDLSLLDINSRNTTLYFSKDDPCIPISHAEKYKAKLKNVKIEIFESKNGHFKIEEFPEIIDAIKKDVKQI